MKKFLCKKITETKPVWRMLVEGILNAILFLVALYFLLENEDFSNLAIKLQEKGNGVILDICLIISPYVIVMFICYQLGKILTLKDNNKK